MADIQIEFTDNSDEVLRELENRVQVALEAVGIQAEGYAKKLTPVGRPFGGTLRQSITHAVKGNNCYIGTNIPYAPFVEWGTGIYATDGNGRKSPWSYQDRYGKWHRTKGMEPHHMLKKAASEHTPQYKAIMEHYLKGND